MSNLQDTIQNAKDSLPDITPTPPGMKSEAAAYDLKARLEWGEPALTIIDVRDREMYNKGRIRGAIPMPMEQVVELAQTSLENERDIYVYGESDDQARQAADSLRGAGFQKVAQIMGGLRSWQEVAGPIEGAVEEDPLKASELNVVSRLKAAKETQEAGEAQQS